MMNKSETVKSHQEAWVVFSGQADLPWLKMLKPGFRHCFVLLNDGKHWVSLDPLSNYTDVMVHAVPADFNFPLWLADRGHKVMPTKLNRDKKPAPWMVFTCVEAVKRVLGIHKRTILTPWQLYRHLQSSFNQGDFAWEA
jgi:hypothetical protein